MVADNSAGDDSSAPTRLPSLANIQQAETGYEQALEQAYGKLPSFVNTSSIDAGIESSIKKSMDSYAQQQYQQLLSADLDTQAAPNFSGHNYNAYTATQLKQMVSTNMDPSAAGESASAWSDIGNDYVTVAQGLGQAASGSEYGWQGAAGDATRDFIGGVSKWAGSAGQGAQLAGNRLAVQSEAASTARNSMPTSPTEPPTSADISSAMLQGGFNPAIGAAKLNAQFAQAAADHAEAVQAAKVYDSSLATSGEKFPAFNAPPTFDTAARGGPSAPAGGTGVPGLGAAGSAPRTNATFGGSGSSARRAGVPGSREAAVAPLPAAGARGSGTGPGGVGAGATSTGTTSTTTTSTSSASNPGGGNPGAANPAGSNPGAGILGAGNPGGASSGGANSGGNGWSGPGWGSDPSFSGSLVGDGGDESVLGGGVGRGGFVNGGGRSGVGAGAVGAEEMEGGVGVRSGAAGEPGGAGMMPRGSGKGGGDSEHKRPDYLQNPDPNATFGSDEYVVPPVIGE